MESSLQKLIQEESYSHEKWDQYFSQLFKANEFDEVIAAADVATKKYGPVYAALWVKVLACLAKRDETLYVETLKACCEMDEQHAGCYLLLAEYKGKQGDKEGMELLLDIAMRKEPEITKNTYLRTAPPFLRSAMRQCQLYVQNKQRALAEGIISNLQVKGDVSRLSDCFDRLFAAKRKKAMPVANFAPDLLYFPGIRHEKFYQPEDKMGLSILNDYQGDIESEYKAISQNWCDYIEQHSGTDKKLELTQFSNFDQQEWKSYHLYRYGKLEENCRLCPKTSEALERIGMPKAGKFMPEAFFSRLGPGSEIPPHYGLSNVRLAVHWPIVIPDNCGITVGGETKRWQIGEPLIFDDSFLHSAFNHSDQLRTVLIFDSWHPDLTDVEIEGLSSFLNLVFK